MPTTDPFLADAFSLRSMMDAVNLLPYTPGRVSALGLFDEKGIATTTVQIEEKAGLLSLVPTSLYGEAATQSQRENRKMRSFVVPHLALEDSILAYELQNIRAFGTENTLQSIETVRNERLEVMTRWLDATLEHLRIGALRGQILDADGVTVILNLFTEFQVTQVAEYALDLTSASADPMAKANAIVRSIQNELGAARMAMRWVHALCSPTLFDEFVTNKFVKESFQRYQDNTSAGVVGSFLRDSHVRQPPFFWGGIMWEEYADAGAGIGSFIPADKAIFFPVGVPGLFVNYYAPADFAETVNTLGLPRYSKAAVDLEFNRWVKLHLQSNPLPMCLRPRVLQIARKGV